MTFLFIKGILTDLKVNLSGINVMYINQKSEMPGFMKEIMMSKAHRGFGVREFVKSGRGECPVCKRTGIKILYDFEKDGKKLMICKQCKVAVARGKKAEASSAV